MPPPHFLFRAGRSRLPRHTVATVVEAWTVAAALAATAPAVVSGGDVIPVTPVVAPVLACLVTAFALLTAVTAPRRTTARTTAS
ncbi:MAG: hypothetical protein QM747_05750 [Nocardioides sp.]